MINRALPEGAQLKRPPKEADRVYPLAKHQEYACVYDWEHRLGRGHHVGAASPPLVGRGEGGDRAGDLRARHVRIAGCAPAGDRAIVARAELLAGMEQAVELVLVLVLGKPVTLPARPFKGRAWMVRVAPGPFTLWAP
jgi:hypothetical protein